MNLQLEKVVFSHPTGNANSRAVAEGLVEAKILGNFYTCIAVFENSPAFLFTKIGPLREFQKRIFRNSLKPYTLARPYMELCRIAAQRIGWKKLILPEEGKLCVDKVYEDLDEWVSRKLNESTAVYAYEDGALQSFKRAKILGAFCLYDLPIGYWKSMRIFLEEERLKQPQWAETIGGFKDSENKLKKKDLELQLADHIFVASTFTAKTLKSFTGDLAPVHIIPYGFPPVAEQREYVPVLNRRLKILFVGGLSQRKGISYLFKATEELKDIVELTIVGQKPHRDCQILNENLAKYTWIPQMSHPEILQLMRKQDVLIFPSLFEGFGLVVTEAMSQGTPVITTDRTCGPDVITHGQNGWIIKAGSADSIKLQLEEILEKPECLEKVGRAAMETAKARPWSQYSREIATKVWELLKSGK